MLICQISRAFNGFEELHGCIVEIVLIEGLKVRRSVFRCFSAFLGDPAGR